MRSRMLPLLGMAGAALMILGSEPRAQAAPAGYPTEALADYVFGCMAANGGTQDALHRCSCSIDHVAAKLSYDDYVQAETVLRMQRVPGGRPRRHVQGLAVGDEDGRQAATGADAGGGAVFLASRNGERAARGPTAGETRTLASSLVTVATGSAPCQQAQNLMPRSRPPQRMPSSRPELRNW